MRFKDLIELYRISRYKLAKKAEIDPSIISKIANGTRDPLNMSTYSSKKISKALKLTLDEYFDLLQDDDIFK